MLGQHLATTYWTLCSIVGMAEYRVTLLTLGLLCSRVWNTTHTLLVAVWGLAPM